MGGVCYVTLTLHGLSYFEDKEKHLNYIEQNRLEKSVYINKSKARGNVYNIILSQYDLSCSDEKENYRNNNMQPIIINNAKKVEIICGNNNKNKSINIDLNSKVTVSKEDNRKLL